MERDQLITHLAVRAVIVALVLAAPAALAQNGAQAPAPAELQTPHAADPAPGAEVAFAGHSERPFYDIDGRIARFRQRIDAEPAGSPKSDATRQLAAIQTEEKAQITRHGSLLDWARENLNRRLDRLVKAYPDLAG